VLLVIDPDFSPRPLLVLDFDGTVCVGDAPVLAYAEAAIGELEADLDRETFERSAAEIRGRLGAFLDAEHGDAVVIAPYVDGYGAVAAIAGEFLDRDRLYAAFLASRRALADGGIVVGTPTGLAEFLDELGTLGRGIERVLVTNSPAGGILETLARLGIADSIDRVVTSAAKPTGWEWLLPELLEGRAPSAILSVGDIWRNDLEAFNAAGCVTAFIDRFGQDTVPATVVASHFEGLYESIRDWAAAATGVDLIAHP
jgi:FMN phosphatase YigB (HAD superfamily)